MNQNFGRVAEGGERKNLDALRRGAENFGRVAKGANNFGRVMRGGGEIYFQVYVSKFSVKHTASKI